LVLIPSRATPTAGLIDGTFDDDARPCALRKNARNVTRNDRSVHACHSGRFVGNAIAVPSGITIK
jgi:hypothetical protein